MADGIYAMKLIAIERKFLFIRIGRNYSKFYRKDSVDRYECVYSVEIKKNV